MSKIDIEHVDISLAKYTEYESNYQHLQKKAVKKFTKGAYGWIR